MADLLRLPSARIFPPLLGSKRGRKADGPAPGPLDDAATAPPRAAHPLLAGGMQLRGKGAGLLRDPTSLLLLEAASQLNELVHAQLERRMLKVSRQGGAAEAAPTDSVSEAEEEAGGACESACGAVCVAALSLRSTQHAADRTSATVTASASLDGSLPESGPVSLSRNKRIRLERQYAIDLSGLCVTGAQRQPLPDAEELACLVR